MKRYQIRAKGSNGDWLYLGDTAAMFDSIDYAETFNTQQSAMKAAVWAMLEWPRLTDWEMEDSE
jgi:hypothetical protein